MVNLERDVLPYDRAAVTCYAMNVGNAFGRLGSCRSSVNEPHTNPSHTPATARIRTKEPRIECRLYRLREALSPIKKKMFLPGSSPVPSASLKRSALASPMILAAWWASSMRCTTGRGLSHTVPSKACGHFRQLPCRIHE